MPRTKKSPKAASELFPSSPSLRALTDLHRQIRAAEGRYEEQKAVLAKTKESLKELKAKMDAAIDELTNPTLPGMETKA